MQLTVGTDISQFYVAGINYKKIDAGTRGQFAINPDQYTNLLQKAASFHLKEFFILSTCNRTEIYGFADQAERLIDFLCSETIGSSSVFLESAYIRKGEAAVSHLFEVGAGLDSQLLGDYEIIGQIKSAVKFSRQSGFIGAFNERLVNAVLQASKAIKNQTMLSGGTVSVSFAAVQYIKEQITDPENKNILLIGTGKIGRNTCKNLVDYLGVSSITLVNRTDEKAIQLANELNLKHASLNDIQHQISQADIILVASNAPDPVVLTAHLGNAKKLVIDLSLPCNVEESAANLPNIDLINVDQLSKLKDETLSMRQAEVPKARAIILEHLAGFMDWCEMRKHVPLLKAVMIKLKEIENCTSFARAHSLPISTQINSEQNIQRIINGMASKIRVKNNRGCHYIEAINEYIAIGKN